jgi:hypothetical protein
MERRLRRIGKSPIAGQQPLPGCKDALWHGHFYGEQKNIAAWERFPGVPIAL